MDKSTKKYLLNILRQATMSWRGRTDCLKAARVRKVLGVYGNGKVRYKYFWKCAKCLNEFRDQAQMEVDHIEEVGPFKGDWNDYIARMFCSLDNLQVLCLKCHSAKTSKYNAALRFQRKPKPT